jgi:hypothetical protein
MGRRADDEVFRLAHQVDPCPAKSPLNHPQVRSSSSRLGGARRHHRGCWDFGSRRAVAFASSSINRRAGRRAAA